MLSVDQIVALVSPVREMAGADAWRAAMARLVGAEAVVPAPAEDQWPPDPATIDPHDGSWLLAKVAADVVGCSIDTIYRRAATEAIGVKVGGVWWVHRARLLSGRTYPKRPA